MDSDIVDTWTVVEGDIAMRTSVVAGGKFVTVERMIKMGADEPEMAVMPFARVDELDRLIAALQHARNGEAKAELPPTRTSVTASSLLAMAAKASSLLAMSAKASSLLRTSVTASS